jgi:hypothetical protein
VCGLCERILSEGTSIEAEGYETRPDFISLVKRLNFTGGLEENPYKHLQVGSIEDHSHDIWDES